MFFMISVTQGRKELKFSQMVICDKCGKYGRYSVFMTYSVLALFFIPCFKWKKQYFVQSSCCNCIYQLNPEIGRRIEHGEELEIQTEDLSLLYGQPISTGKCCEQCGYRTEEDFAYCPKCGAKL